MQKSGSEIISYAIKTISIVAEAVVNLTNLLTDDFVLCVEKIINSTSHIASQE